MNQTNSLYQSQVNKNDQNNKARQYVYPSQSQQYNQQINNMNQVQQQIPKQGNQNTIPQLMNVNNQYNRMNLHQASVNNYANNQYNNQQNVNNNQTQQNNNPQYMNNNYQQNNQFNNQNHDLNQQYVQFNNNQYNYQQQQHENYTNQNDQNLNLCNQQHQNQMIQNSYHQQPAQQFYENPQNQNQLNPNYQNQNQWYQNQMSQNQQLDPSKQQYQQFQQQQSYAQQNTQQMNQHQNQFPQNQQQQMQQNNINVGNNFNNNISTQQQPQIQQFQYFQQESLNSQQEQINQSQTENQFIPQQYGNQQTTQLKYRNLSQLQKAKSQIRENQLQFSNQQSISKSEIKCQNPQFNTNENNINLKELQNFSKNMNQSPIKEKTENVELSQKTESPKQVKLFPIKDTTDDNQKIEKLQSLILTDQTYMNLQELQKKIKEKNLKQLFNFENIKNIFKQLIETFINKSTQNFILTNQLKLFDQDKIIKEYNLSNCISDQLKTILDKIHKEMIKELFQKKTDSNQQEQQNNKNKNQSYSFQKQSNQYQEEEFGIFDVRLNESKIKTNLLQFLKNSLESQINETITFKCESITQLTFKQINEFKDQDKNNQSKEVVSQFELIVSNLAVQILQDIKKAYQMNDSDQKDIEEMNLEYSQISENLNQLINQFYYAYKQRNEENNLTALVLYKKISILKKNLNKILQDNQIMLNKYINDAIFKDKSLLNFDIEQVNENVSNCFKTLIFQETFRIIESFSQVEDMVIDLANCTIDSGRVQQTYKNEQYKFFLDKMRKYDVFSNIDEKIQFEDTLNKYIKKENLDELFKNEISELKLDDIKSFNENQKIFYLQYIVTKMNERLQNSAIKLINLKQQSELQFFQRYFDQIHSITFFDQAFVQTFPYDQKENTVYLKMSTFLEFKELTFKLKNQQKDKIFKIDLQNSRIENQVKTDKSILDYINKYKSERQNILNLFFQSNKTHNSGLVAMYLYEKQTYLILQTEIQLNFLQKIKTYFFEEPKFSILNLDFKSYIDKIEKTYECCQEWNKFLSDKQFHTYFYDIQSLSSDSEFSRFLEKKGKQTYHNKKIYIFEDDLGIPAKVIFKTEDYQTIMISFSPSSSEVLEQIKQAKIKIYEFQFISEFEKTILFMELERTFQNNKTKEKIFFFECLLETVLQNKNSESCQFELQFMNLLHQSLQQQYSKYIQNYYNKYDSIQIMKQKQSELFAEQQLQSFEPQQSQTSSKSYQFKYNIKSQFENQHNTQSDKQKEQNSAESQNYLQNQEVYQAIKYGVDIDILQEKNKSLIKKADIEQKNNNIRLSSQIEEQTELNQINFDQKNIVHQSQQQEDNSNKYQKYKNQRSNDYSQGLSEQYELKNSEQQKNIQDIQQNKIECIKKDELNQQIYKIIQNYIPTTDNNSFKQIFNRKIYLSVNHLLDFEIINEFRQNLKQSESILSIYLEAKKIKSFVYLFKRTEPKFIIYFENKYYYFSKNKNDYIQTGLGSYQFQYIFIEENYKSEIFESYSYELVILELFLWIQYQKNEIKQNTQCTNYKKNLNYEVFRQYQQYLWIKINLQNIFCQSFFSNKIIYDKQVLYNTIDLQQKFIRSDAEYTFTKLQHKSDCKYIIGIIIEKKNKLNSLRDIVLLHNNQISLFNDIKYKVQIITERSILKCNSEYELNRIYLYSLPSFIIMYDQDGKKLVETIDYYLQLLDKDFCIAYKDFTQ